MISKKTITYILIFFSYLSFLIGFFLNENSIGSGGYDGDLIWIWKNFEIFKNNSLLNSIFHEDFFGNRPPLLYLINYLFNPFINNIYYYRASILFFSFLGPIIFYFCLKIKYKNVEKELLLLISSVILLSPYYRTSAYWGMEINYSIIAMLATYYYYLKINFNNNNFKNWTSVFLLIFFSSLTIYFDQKYLFIPIIVFFKIITSKFYFKMKLFSLTGYLILSIPYLFLIYKWNGIVPPSTQIVNPYTVTNLNRLNFLHVEHIGYAISIIAFYLLPFIFFIKEDLNKFLKVLLKNKNIYILLIIFFIYLFFLIKKYNFEYYTIEKYSKYNFGLGITHKLTNLITNNIFIREILTYFSFIFSWIVIVIYANKDWIYLFAIFFLLFMSLFVFPLMQEYFDLIITLSALLIFKKKFLISHNRVFLFYSYFTVYLIGCITYYY